MNPCFYCRRGETDNTPGLNLPPINDHQDNDIINNDDVNNTADDENIVISDNTNDVKLIITSTTYVPMITSPHQQYAAVAISFNLTRIINMPPTDR